MTSAIAELTVDEFHERGFAGWAIVRTGTNIKECPIFIAYNSGDFVEVAEFNNRPDVRNAGFGSGAYGFSIQKAVPVGTRVDVFETSSGKRLWSGTVGFPYERKSSIELSDRAQRLVKDPEHCLSLVTKKGIAPVGESRGAAFNVYELELSVGNRPIRYLQTIHDEQATGGFLLSSDTHRVTSVVAGHLDKFVLQEHFLVPVVNGAKRPPAPKALSVAFKDNVTRAEAKVSCERIATASIFVSSTTDEWVIRPNVAIDVRAGKVTPVNGSPPWQWENRRFAVPRSNSAILVDGESGKVTWTPARFKRVGEKDVSRGLAKNIVPDSFRSPGISTAPETCDLEGLVRYYNQHGARELMEALYGYLLERDGDASGVQDVLNDLNSRIANRGLLAALNGIWERFTSSDEYRSKKFKILKLPGEPGYPFSG